jgi:hypothetical protein
VEHRELKDMLMGVALNEDHESMINLDASSLGSLPRGIDVQSHVQQWD